MKLTIGMASYNNAEQVWWTIQSLKMYQDLTDVELIVVDNQGCAELANWCVNWGGVKYVKYTEKRGTAIAKEQVFKNATGDFVLCIDSHVMFKPDSIKKLKEWIDNNQGSKDLYHGVMMYDDFTLIDRMEEIWRGDMLGIWGEQKKEVPNEPYEIPMHGGGCIGAFRENWLHYNEEFLGFGGEEGYIHRKYRQQDRKIMCLPFLQWLHRFEDHITKPRVLKSVAECIRNYIIGWIELGLDIQEIKDNFKGWNIEYIKKPEGELSILNITKL